MSESMEYRNELRQKGYRAVPVTVVGVHEIVGFDVAQLSALIKR